jgi:protocatechuate 3,4-dioxygenase beta subunit
MASAGNNNSRRQFLRNIAFTSLGLAFLPDILRTKANAQPPATNSCDPVTLDYYGQGPFYSANAPDISNNILAPTTEPGTRIILSGVVQTLDCTKHIANTKLDIWHANDAGEYDNSGYKLRGVTYSNAQGFYTLETILPGKYLNGSAYRPRHIHFKITPPGFPTIITQLYFEGDTDIPGDAAASIKSGTYDATHRIISINKNAQDKYEGTWNIAIDGNGTTGMGEIHLNKGIIYSASPNPFTNNVEIKYGVFKPNKVSIQVFDNKGALVAVLDERNLQPEKYTANWQPDENLPKGIYWISLKMNDLQVHYLKVIKA